MNKERAKLLITAFESWEHDRHWQTAILIAVIGSFAFFLSPNQPQNTASNQPQATIQNTNQNQPATTQNTASNPPANMQGNVIQATPPPPTRLSPKKSTDNIEIEETEKDEFAKFKK